MVFSREKIEALDNTFDNELQVKDLKFLKKNYLRKLVNTILENFAWLKKTKKFWIV